MLRIVFREIILSPEMENVFGRDLSQSSNKHKILEEWEIY